MSGDVFFSSDHHFGHSNIIKYCDRPFWKNQVHPAEPDVDAMNEALIERWNETVSPGDMVFYLGDFAMGKVRETLPIVGLLNGDIYLIPGNHDRCWTGNKKVGNWPEKYVEAGFTDVCYNHVTFEEFDLCHFPFSKDERHGDRYQEFRPKPSSRILLHGHVHDSWKVNGPQVNVGCDVWNYAPVHIDIIKEVCYE